ncbi:purine nucleotide synthesis repressor [Klebsiella pneumoniae]|nr:purine nucleotide synthesis repressor [Klebsiella pneumoniae]
MATIKDVAKRANVSTTTVSHVINKTRFVAEETRNAVWAAIKELHYSPSAVARSLKVNHTKSIGLLATSSEAAYFAEIIESVEKSCFQKGYTLILGNAWNDLEKQRAYLSMMAQKRVDGLLVMCSEYPDSVLSMLEEYRHIPMVVMDWGEAKADFTDAVIDNAFQGGYIAGRYLIERGHREIGVIPGPLERNTGAGRLGRLHAGDERGAYQRAGKLDCAGRLRAGVRLPRNAADPKPAAPPDGGLLRRRYHGDGRYLRGG